MNRRLERIEIDGDNRLLSKYRILLIAFTLTLIWVTTVWGAESYRQPKSIALNKRAQIAKRSEWIETKVNQDEEFHAKKADLLADKRHRLEAEIEKVLARTRKTPNEQRKAYTMRLAQYFLEDYYYELGRAYRIYDQIEKQGKKAVLDPSRAHKYLAKSRGLYTGLLRDYPTDKQHDEMLYFYALICLNQDLTNEAIGTFEKLRIQHPQSKYTPDATAQLGDYYFERAQFKKAEEYYDALMKSGYKPLLPYAIYKKAWCEYKDARIDASLAHFKWVILNEGSLTAAVPMQIRNEALNDIALPFADIGEQNPPLDFYKSQGPVAFRRGVEAIANIWQDRGRYKDAAQYYEELLAVDLLYVKNGDYEGHILEGLIKQNRLAEAVERTFAALPRYMDGSPWYQANGAKPEGKEQMAKWEDTTRKLALLLHQNTQNTKNAQTRALAIKTYESYLHYFPTAPEAINLRNNLAMLQFKEGEYFKAAGNYIRVYKDSKQEPQKQEALANAFSAYHEQMNRERKLQGLGELSKTSKSKIAEASMKESPLSDTETKLIKLGDLYVTKYPKANDAPEVMHETGYVKYSHRAFEDALKTFRDLVNNYQNHEMSVSASYLVLDILNQLKDYDALVLSCKNLLKAGPNKKEFRENVARVLRQTELKRIAILEENKKYEQAANAYLNFSKEYGSQERQLQETALFNAAQNFYKAELFGPAVETQEAFLQAFPQSSHAAQTRLEIARMYEQFGLYSKAAPLYEQFALSNPKHPQSSNALRMAGLLYWGAGNVKRAETLLLTLQKESRRDAKLAESDLLEIYESTGKIDKQIQMHYQAVKDYENSPAEVMQRKMAIADLRMQKKAGRVPASLMNEIVELGESRRTAMKRSPAAIDAYSKAKIWTLLVNEAMFKRLKFKQANMEKTLKTKINMMKELETEYQKISKLGSPTWGLSGMYKTGRLYSVLATDIEQAPLPPELKGQQLDMYRSGIQKTFVEPFRKKALSFAEACIAQADKLMILSPWTERCYSLASGLDPKRFSKVRTFYLPPVQMSLMTPDFDKSRIKLGSLDETEHPYSSPLFFKSPDRVISQASNSVETALLAEEMFDISDGRAVAPSSFSYRNLQKDQQETAQRSITSEKPSNAEDLPTFSYLNSLRLYSPRAAVTAIQGALKRDPNNAALTNLLAMAFLDQENFAAAKVTWLSLSTRQKKTAGILNNLGVLALQESRHTRALKYFTDAHLLEPGGGATMNLGFLALKNHIGSEAKKYFEQCIEKTPKSAPSQIGRMVALIQMNEFDSLRKEIEDLTTQYKSDPYARLSVSYFLIDAANEPEMARQILSEYLNGRAVVEQDQPFRKALEETGRMAQKDKELISEEELNTVEASLQ